MASCPNGLWSHFFQRTARPEPEGEHAPASTTWTEKAKAYAPGWSSFPVCVQKFVNVTPLEKKDS